MRANYHDKTITGKIVYYGPGLCGKTTNLEQIFGNMPEEQRLHTKLLEAATTGGDRTLFFDYLPIDAGKLNGYDVKIGLYTVPGQVHHYSTRKAVLQGTDAVVFVADSQPIVRDSNIYALQELKTYITEHGIEYKNTPCVLQFNKRDVDGVMPIELMLADLQQENEPYIEAVAFMNKGVSETLKKITSLMLKKEREKLNAQK